MNFVSPDVFSQVIYTALEDVQMSVKRCAIEVLGKLDLPPDSQDGVDHGSGRCRISGRLIIIVDRMIWMKQFWDSEKSMNLIAEGESF